MRLSHYQPTRRQVQGVGERVDWPRLVSAAISDDPNYQGSEEEKLRSYLTSRDTKLSSITRTWLVERGYSVDS